MSSLNQVQLKKKHPTEVNVAGSKDKLIGRNGEINGFNSQDVLQKMDQLLREVNSGTTLNGTELEKVNHQVNLEEVKKDRKQRLTAAYHTPPFSRDWSSLGAEISGEVSETADRDGFMRRMFTRSEVSQSSIARIRVHHKNVTAMMASSPTQLYPQFLYDKYILPPEFWIKANIFVDERELYQGSGDVLEEKYFEGLESIMVEEDRVWKRLADSTVGFKNARQILSGGLTPSTLSKMRTQIIRWNLPAQNILFASDIWNDIVGSNEFGNWFDPVTQYEIVMTGNIGTLIGMNVITDAFREPNLKVLDAGEVYTIAAPEYHGTYTDRGPVESTEANRHETGEPGRGWFMRELMSFTMHNPASVVKGIADRG